MFIETNTSDSRGRVCHVVHSGPVLVSRYEQYPDAHFGLLIFRFIRLLVTFFRHDFIGCLSNKCQDILRRLMWLAVVFLCNNGHVL